MEIMNDLWSFFSSYVAEVQILVIHPQQNKAVGTGSVVLQEWTTEQLNPSQRVDFHTEILGKLENHLAVLVSRKCSISMSSLGKGLLSPEVFGVLSQILLFR